MERTKCICGQGDLYVFDRVLDSYRLYSSTGTVEESVENKEPKGTGSNPAKISGKNDTTQKRKRSVKRRRKERSDKGKKRGARK